MGDMCSYNVKQYVGRGKGANEIEEGSVSDGF